MDYVRVAMNNLIIRIVGTEQYNFAFVDFEVKNEITYRQVDAPICAGAVVPAGGSEEVVGAGHEGAGDGLVDGRHQHGSSAAR